MRSSIAPAAEYFNSVANLTRVRDPTRPITVVMNVDYDLDNGMIVFVDKMLALLLLS